MSLKHAESSKQHSLIGHVIDRGWGSAVVFMKACTYCIRVCVWCVCVCVVCVCAVYVCAVYVCVVYVCLCGVCVCGICVCGVCVFV